MPLPRALILIGVVGFLSSFLLAAILKWFGLAIAVIGVVLQFWPKDSSQNEHLPKDRLPEAGGRSDEIQYLQFK